MPEETSGNIPENKLQIRAKLLSAIAKIQNTDTADSELSELKKITDKDSVLEILQKEFLKENTEKKDYTITFLLSNLIEKEKIEKSLFETLANPKINDSIKTKIVGFLRDIGEYVDYSQYASYFENPDEIIDADTEKLLENAKINPEAQIDFLDFLTALPDSEKEMLVNSLSQDYDGDNLTNILIPVILSNPYSELAFNAVKAIGESKSPLAYPVLQWLNENIDDLKIKSNVQKSINLLKLSGIKTDITKEYYKKLLQNTPVYKCYINFPDGHGNVGLIFSRKHESGFIQMFALVLNDTDGIIDCFGFNEISDDEFERIVNKFYQNNKVIETSAEFCKFLMEDAEKTSRLKFENIPYEYIAWKTITNDIEDKKYNLYDGLEQIELNELLMKQIYNQGYFDRWFFEINDNEAFKQLIEQIFTEKISDTQLIEEKINTAFDSIFDTAQTSILNKRLLLCAHLACSDNEKTDADILFSLTQNNQQKQKFMFDYVKKSIYQYYLLQKDKYYSLKNATSIFARKSNKELNETDIKYIESCLKNLEKKWISNA